MSRVPLIATGKVYNPDSTTAQFLTPKFAKASVAQSQTDSAVVTAVTGAKIRVLDVKLSGPTATSVTFNTKPGGAGTAVSAAFVSPSNTVASLGFNPLGHFETSSGEGLTVTTGAGGTVAIQITYIEVY